MVVRHLLKQYLARGHTVDIMTLRFPRLAAVKSKENLDGVPIERFPVLPLVYDDPGYFISRALFHQDGLSRVYHGLRTVSQLGQDTFKLIRSLYRYRADLVHILYAGENAVYPLLASYFYQTKIITTLQGFSVQRLPQLPGQYSWIFERILGRSDLITTCSQALLTDAQTRVPTIKSKSRVIYNGIDLTEFNSYKPYPHPRPYILAVGRLSREKGFDILLLAFTQVMEQGYGGDLIIAGASGSEERHILNLIRLLQLEKRVILLTGLPREEVVALYHGCKFFVLPSRVEPFGIVNLEAMAAGKAIVATNTYGVPEIVKDGYNGLLVVPKDPDALAQGMIRLLDDPDLRVRLGENGQQFVKQFSWDKIARQYLELYNEVLAGG